MWYIVFSLFIGLTFDRTSALENTFLIKREATNKTKLVSLPALTTSTPSGVNPCVCGVYLNGQFTKGKPPKSPPVFMHEFDDQFLCNSIGGQQCQSKCFDVLIKQLSNSPTLMCGASDRDVYKERAYLFIKNCDDVWTNTNFSAGREFCCKGGKSYKCPE